MNEIQEDDGKQCVVWYLDRSVCSLFFFSGIKVKSLMNHTRPINRANHKKFYPGTSRT
jgi:hypothetical protein